MIKSSDQWTNKEVEKDPKRWHALRRQEREQAERQRKELEEERDFRDFEKMFLERGGEPSKAREMYAKYRNDAALEAAKVQDQQTLNAMQAQRRKAV